MCRIGDTDYDYFKFKRKEEKKMRISEVITTRRTIKKFKNEGIDRSRILSWLEDASMAPNHKMTEPWEIFFIGPETRANLNHKTDFGGAPTVFAVISKKGATTIEREENIAATACFIQNFLLEAWNEGVGVFWSSIGHNEKNRDILSVPVDYDVIGVLAVGYPEEIPNVKPRVSISEKIKELS
jgi:nitroreductase